jgi:predicted anti-sigma-YlaC factor YlaD
MAAQSGKLARIRYCAVVTTSSTDEPATLDAAKTTLSITAKAKRHWDRSSTASVRIFTNTGAITSHSHVRNHAIGTITFTTPHSTAKTYTLDVEWMASSYLGRAQNWSVESSVDMLETTAFSTSTAGAGWRTFTPGLNQASAQLSRILTTGDTGPIFFDRMNADQAFVLELVLNNTAGERLEGFARIDADTWTDPIDGLAGESPTFRIDGPLYWSTGYTS